MLEQSEATKNTEDIINTKKEYLSLELAQALHEKEQAEEALRRSEKRFASVFHFAPFPMVIIRLADNTFIDVNEAFVKESGYSRTELVGNNAEDKGILIDPDDNKKVLKILQETGSVKGLEIRSLIHHNEIRYALIYAEIIDFDGGSCLLAAFQNVTEQKKASEEFRRREEEIRALVENAPHIIDRYDLQMRHLYINPAIEQFSGIKVNDYIGKTNEELGMGAQLTKLFKEASAKVIETRQEVNVEFIFHTLLGQRYFHTRVVPEFAPDGAIESLLCISRDINDFKLTEQKLQESQQLFERIADATPDVLFLYDLEEDRMVYCNSQLANILGYNPDDVLAMGSTMLAKMMNNTDILPSEDRLKFYNTVRDGAIIEREARARHINGQWRWMHIRYLAFSRRPDGKIKQLVGTAQDITERKRADALLAGQNRVLEMLAKPYPLNQVLEELAEIIEAQTDGLLCSVLLLDKNGKALRHGAAPSLPESYIKAIDGVLIGPEVGSCGTAAYLGKPVIVSDIATSPLWKDYCELALEHNLRACWSVPIFSNSGKVLGTLAMYYNEPRTPTKENLALIELATNLAGIAIEHKQAQEQLTNEKERLSVTLRYIGDGVITTDTEGHITLINQVAENLVGWNQSEVMGKPLIEVYRTLDRKNRQPSEDFVPQIVTSRQNLQRANNLVLLRRDGSERIIMDTCSPICDEQGQVIGVVTAFRDITDIIRASDELQKASKLESLGLLAGGIAHDFNNILTTIIGNLSFARMSVEVDNELYPVLADLEQASVRARDLTQQLLTFAKGGAPVRKAALLPQLVEESARFAARGSNVQCEFSLPENLWPVEVDRGQLSQVIQNLVINAIQAMPFGGKIEIEGQNLNLPSLSAIPLPQGRYIKLAVRDYGTGIDPENISRIFDPYFTTKEHGSGLGLATCYSIVRRHDGYLAVETDRGAGTTFVVYLPAANLEVTSAKVENQLTKPTSGSGRVLVMDDDHLLQLTIERILKRLGYAVVLASDGMVALEEYRKAQTSGNPITAVIMDLTVPGGMGGREAIGKLLDSDPQAKVLVSSGYSSDQVMANYRAWGFAGVIAKPYRVEELSRILQEVIGQELAP